MNITRKLFVFPILSIFIFSCSKATLPLSLKERLHNAYLDVIEEDESAKLKNTVYDEMDKTNFYKSLYLLAFKTYEGFEEL